MNLDAAMLFPVAQLTVAFLLYRRGLRRGRNGQLGAFGAWSRRFDRYVPLAMGVAGIMGLGASSVGMWGMGSKAMMGSAVLVSQSAWVAAWVAGFHAAGSDENSPVMRRIVYGPTGWAAAAAVGTASLLIVPAELLMFAVLFPVIASAGLAVQKSPMYVTKRAIAEEAFRERGRELVGDRANNRD